MKDTATLKKFRSICLSSDYAASLVDKAISASKAKQSKDAKDPLSELIKGESEQESKDAKDLIEKLLKVIPEDRINADDAIRHPYVAKFYNPALEDKVTRRKVLPPLDDDIQLSIDEYRHKLYEIIQKDKAR